MLLALRRFADAERAFDPAAAPVEWALAASRRGQRREAADVLARSGFYALAALELDAANEPGGRAGAVGAAAARRTAARPALRIGAGPFQLGRGAAPPGRSRGRPAGLGPHPGAAGAAGRRVRAARAAGTGVRLLRHVAAAGARLGVVRERVRGLPERHPAAGGRRSEVLRAPVLRGLPGLRRPEPGVAGGGHPGARSGRILPEGRPAVRAALPPALGQPVRRGRPPGDGRGRAQRDGRERAGQAAIDVSAALGDLALCGELYAAAAELPLPPKRKDRYAALAARFRAKGERAAPGPVVPGLPAADRRLPGRLAPGHHRVGAGRPAGAGAGLHRGGTGGPRPVRPGGPAGAAPLRGRGGEPGRARARPRTWRTPWARSRCTRCCGRWSIWAGTARPGCGRR